MKWLTGEWLVACTTAQTRRVLHYWATIVWLSLGLGIWIVLRDALWFVGFMSLYAIWVTHIAGWAAETPVEPEDETVQDLLLDSNEAGASTPLAKAPLGSPASPS